MPRWGGVRSNRGPETLNVQFSGKNFLNKFLTKVSCQKFDGPILVNVLYSLSLYFLKSAAIAFAVTTDTFQKEA